LFGPVLGAFLLEAMAEALRELLALLGVDVPGARQLFFGFCLLFVVMLLPDGVWPWLSRKLRITETKL
jgi:branched-chain amino acid transport system permease protein